MFRTISLLLMLALASCVSTRPAQTAAIDVPVSPAGAANALTPAPDGVSPMTTGSVTPAAESPAVPGHQSSSIHSVIAANPADDAADAAASSGLAGRVIYVDDTRDLVLAPKEVVLTFDDGPVPKNTPSILDTLDAHGVKATFFMVGEMAKWHSSVAAQVAAHGETIGTHTFSHPNLPTLSLAAGTADIDKGIAAVKAATGVDPHFFRFPYLAENAGLDKALADRNIIPVGVDVDSIDYRSATPDLIVSRIMDGVKKHDGGIILMHDLQSRTARFLPALLDQLEAGGYKVVQLKYGEPPAIVAAAPDKAPKAEPLQPTLVRMLGHKAPAPAASGTE